MTAVSQLEIEAEGASQDSRSPLGLLVRAPGRVALGLLGSLLVAVAGAHIADRAVRWWFHPWIAPGGDTNTVLLWTGVAALTLAWLGLGRLANSRSSTPAELIVVAALWIAPLLVTAPLFSHDVYSYLAQGTIAHLGLSPYHHAPVVLARLGRTHVLGAVDPFWRRVTAPYGPLFLTALAGIVSITGSHLIAGALAIRALELIGTVLLAIYVPRLARDLGADPARATWLVLLSPLVLIQLVAAGHNDLLMIGVMAAGVALAVEALTAARRPLLGIAVCALAATIKLPAAVAVIFIAVTWARTEPDWRGRLRVLLESALLTLIVLAAVSLITGFGPSWISTSVFATPSKVKLAITPATSVAWTIASALHGGVSANFKSIDSVLRVIAFTLSVGIGLFALARSRLETMPRYLGFALIAFALGGPAAWPWYLTWGLVLLAASRPTQSSPAIVAVMVLGAFLVRPDGTLVLPLNSAPFVLAFYLVIAGLGWYISSERSRRPSAARTALARS
jgi:hypothetical protein